MVEQLTLNISFSLPWGQERLWWKPRDCSHQNLRSEGRRGAAPSGDGDALNMEHQSIYTQKAEPIYLA